MKSISPPPADEAVMRLARQMGVLRARDLNEHGLARVHLRRLLDQGLLESVGRGLYVPVGAPETEFQTFIEVSRRVPNAVFCLLSALRFHGLTTQNPSAVWLAIESRARTPQLETPQLEVVRQSGQAWLDGVGEYDQQLGEAKITLKVTTPAKTVADCFRFRSRVGLDVALEALRDVLQQKRATHDELWRFADVDRVSSVMRPYLEAMSI